MTDQNRNKPKPIGGEAPADDANRLWEPEGRLRWCRKWKREEQRGRPARRPALLRTRCTVTPGTLSIHPIEQRIRVAACLNDVPRCNGQWLVNNITDDYTFTAQPIAPDMSSDQSGTGGVFGYPQSRFAKRTPELWHQAHAVARGQIGP